MSDQLTTEEWVRQLNALALEIEENFDGVHPSAWPEMCEFDHIQKLTQRFKKLAGQPTHDDIQLSFIHQKTTK